MSGKNEVRLGVIGCGSMGQGHMSYFDKVARLKFTAASDVSDDALKTVKDKYGVKTFATSDELINSGEVDAVLIATPHYDHPPLTLAAFKAGVHVLVEKPVAVTAAAAAEVNDAARKHADVVYAAMFQQRLTPAYRKVKELIDEGELGQIRRVSWIITNWFRSQAYYDSGGWRATWKGEGGGVLLNQCPHNLDLFQWIVGRPSKVQAFIGVGKYHHIEVEDEVTAYLEYPNGATGVFITSTGEAPGTNRLEITGDRGKIITDGGPTIEFVKTDVNVSEFCRSTPDRFPKINKSNITIEVDNSNAGHRGITENFVAAVLDGAPLIAPATEGIHSVELANAMIMSGLQHQPVPFPTDRPSYEALLQKLVDESTFEKKASGAGTAASAAEMAKSF